MDTQTINVNLTEDSPIQDQSPPPAKVTRDRIPADLYHSLPRWKKFLLAISMLLMLSGLILQTFDYLRSPDDRHVSTVQNGPEHGLLTTRQLLPDGSSPSESIDHASASLTTLHSWSPALFRMGFGFFAGFCIAYTVRAFLKLCALAAGAVLLALLGLQYAEILEVDWVAIQQYYHTFAGWVAPQLDSFQEFITGFLPSSTTASLGAVVGFMKNHK